MSTEVEKRSFPETEAANGSFKKRKQFKTPKSSNPINSEGLSECFLKVNTSLYISLAPCHLANPINGIKAQHLDPLVMTYFPKAKGVVLSYSNIKIPQDNVTTDSQDSVISIAKVTDSSPFTFLWITVDLLVWTPQLGDVLEGYIYMQTASHIGLLLHDAFNASIKKYNIPSDWRFIPSQVDEFQQDEQDDSNNSRFKSFGYWVDENEVKIEGKLTFTIKAIHTTGRVVSVEGTLIKPGAEKDAQPVLRERRISTSSVTGASASKHKKFDDDEVEDIVPAVAEIPEQEDQESTILPNYTHNSEEEQEDDAVVNNSDSEDESD